MQRWTQSEITWGFFSGLLRHQKVKTTKLEAKQVVWLYAIDHGTKWSLLYRRADEALLLFGEPNFRND